jgi:lysophospholipase L1-like esterase
MIIAPGDERLAYLAPQPVDRTRAAVRLDRFPAEVALHLGGQLGPLANLRSSTGCGVRFATDSPWVELRLDRLRHHQPSPCGVALEVEDAQGAVVAHTDSDDLREREGEVVVRLATGLERGAPPAVVTLWLPPISTAACAGLALSAGAQLMPAPAAPARWLALGDSLTQGFSVQSPRQTWVHRLSRRWRLPAWNLGVGGLKIEPEVVAWALAARSWELVTIALGANHAWRVSDAASAAERAVALAELALSGGHGRVVWILPGWKPCEDGLGPPEFMGVPLDRDAGARGQRIRADVAQALSAYAPRLTVIDNPAPRDHRLYPDGLHPAALGFARFADGLAAALGT